MRRIIKGALLCLLALLGVAATYLGVQSIRLKWWTAPEQARLVELTADQRAADMAYLLDLTRRVSSADAVWEASGLDNPLDAPEVWVERARQAPSNSAFADLIMQYLVHLGQGGHAFPAYDATFNIVTSLVSDAPRDAFAKMPQWGALIARLPWNAHAAIDVVYRDGRYLLDRDARVGAATLPAGAIVERVDGLNVDAFALQQQYRAHLRYDPALRKFFIYPLFSIDPGPDRPGWEVTFRLPDGTTQTLLLKKIPGYVAHRPDESAADNIRCLDLPGNTLYIKIQTFERSYVSQDQATLRQCFSGGSYQKVVFDVRGNGGGEIWSYMDNIIAPMISQPITYEMTSAVKDTFYQWYGWRLWLFQATNSNDLIDPIAHVERVEPITGAPYSERGWRVLRVTRRIAPAAAPYPFAGRAYVLVDNNARSAADSFAAVMQRTGLATVVGANTVGWGQAYQAKMLYALPHSGFLFFMDSELTLNPDGTLNNYVGVIPDITLGASRYPTPYPATLSREALVADPWVQWVLAQ